MSIATYSFLPYLRQGIANSLVSTDGARAEFLVNLEVRGDKLIETIEKKIQIYGPGDVVGIDPRAIFKTDPHNWITNFEPNYLAYIDFYDEDFLWRYTPAAPKDLHLNPWIALVVLAEGEFEEGTNSTNRPLPYIKLKSKAISENFFPKINQLWAWAHVQFNGDLTASEDTILTDNQTEVNTGIDKLQASLNQNPDLAYSRLISPRKLLPNVSYHAFVIPAYESGRLAGIGGDAKAIADAKQRIAWEGSSVEHPFYYRWKFNTGDVGDFEYLVGLIKPKIADSRVGRRVMDMAKPGANLEWVEDDDPKNALGGILRLGGALKVPKESLTDEEIVKTKKFDEWATRTSLDLHPFQPKLASFLNLADDYLLKPALAANTEAGFGDNEDADPLVTPPIYGRWHAMVERVYKDRDENRIDNNYNWLNELNLDPRFRVPAHFGTRVVQENQEDFMQAAWEQIGEVLSVNRLIRFGQVAISSSTALHAKHFTAANGVSPSKLILLTAPVQKRILFDGSTVFHHIRQTVMPNTVISAPMRRLVRPRGRFVRNLQKQLPTSEKLRLESIVTKISTGELLPAPVKKLPVGVSTVDEVATLLEPKGLPAFLIDWLKRFPWLPYVLLVLAVLILILLILLTGLAAGLAIGLVIAGGLILLWKKVMGWAKDLKIADSFKSENKTPQSVDAMPKSSDFKLAALGEKFKPSSGGKVDSDAAKLFKVSLKDMYRLFELTRTGAPKRQPPIPLQPAKLSLSILDQLRPEKTVPGWTWQHVFIPKWIKDQLKDEGFVEAMAYPKINTPMYESLKKISDELFLPNIELIEQNSITVLETNQPFIESYMVGLNHEFGRELLWREYPTDQRGSYFRQFWDTASALKDPALKDKSEDEKREPFYDIPKLHTWGRDSKLGSHDHRQKPGQPAQDELVLVIRGELLKKYPTAVVYAHRAAWTENDPKRPRSLKNAEAGDEEKPNPEFVRTPIYQAKVDPDINFFGFDLTVKEAKGKSESEMLTDDNAGWFFVIKERPGEPRFGLDEPDPSKGDPALISWNDLNWKRVVPKDGVIDVLTLPGSIKLPNAVGDTEAKGQKIQYLEDRKVTWDGKIDAANLAYILYQVPMMVAVHASEMLLQKKIK